MNKFLGYIFSPVFYIFFLLSLLIFHPVQWICYRLFGYKAHKLSVDYLNFFLTYSHIFLGSSSTFINRQNLPLNQPIIFVANHQSMYDIPGLIWFLRKYHVKFISKIELTKGIPSISFNLKYGGGANINRKDSKQAISEIIKLGRRMKEKQWSAMIFAEGTRAKDGKLKPFQVGGIATLLKAVPNALIVPVAIENSWKTVQYGMYPLSFGEKIRWTVLEPINPEGRNPEELTLMAETAIRKALKQETV
ncbi:lysophospholipid acyltransferase family protein [Pedobacter sp. MC2016-15]|jgi:1-acyl-sn-glycerol-3-phosphate acyltransferase|uniref:lysophospholipid acyltransferase family protein n=1 Tax=Pedobacter sp. MC2016-15 TaxID=2994473 RepID=UPI0022469254|nr:lysophospholipid acyltransferase family protein [Pedobacter sp. MC2016-15]MCX2478725.1 lysophospholipid acyltransferase family protein [Pedobacter sp. MC2016-15]